RALLRGPPRLRRGVDPDPERDAVGERAAAVLVARHGGGQQVMFAFFIRRAAFAVFLVFAVSSASLLLATLAPGDFVAESMGLKATREGMEEARARLGLDRSVGAQYRDWLVRAAHLDFGRSLQYDRPVVDLIPERAANTAILALSALVAATLVGLP